MFDAKAFFGKKRVILALSVAFIGLALTATLLGNSLNMSPSESGSITKEEAIEISWSSPTLQKYLENATEYFLVEAKYLNVTVVKAMKEYDPEVYGDLPDEHGVWKIVWGWFLKPYGITSTDLRHSIDEETGEILLELRGLLYF